MYIIHSLENSIRQEKTILFLSLPYRGRIYSPSFHICYGQHFCVLKSVPVRAGGSYFLHRHRPDADIRGF